MLAVALDVAAVHEKVWDAMLVRLQEGINKLQEERLAKFIQNLQRDATLEGLKAYGDDVDEINLSIMTSGSYH